MFYRKRMFQKRWVKFDGHSICYYNNEKVSFLLQFSEIALRVLSVLQ